MDSRNSREMAPRSKLQAAAGLKIAGIISDNEGKCEGWLGSQALKRSHLCHVTSGTSFSLLSLSVPACKMGREDSEEVSTVSASAGT